MMVNTVVARINAPCLERPLFLLQYVPISAVPVKEPNPASFPSCIKINIINIIDAIINITVNAVLTICLLILLLLAVEHFIIERIRMQEKL